LDSYAKGVLSFAPNQRKSCASNPKLVKVFGPTN
jgi:hypothetical protein